MSLERKKFATQVDSTLLESVRRLAKAEGRQIQAVVEDALRQHLDAKQGAKNRGSMSWLPILRARKGFLGCTRNWLSELRLYPCR